MFCNQSISKLNVMHQSYYRFGCLIIDAKGQRLGCRGYYQYAIYYQLIILMTSNRTLSLLFSQEQIQRMAQSHILIVGVGGIGCELLKNLSKSGFRKFTILDLDHIQETNLNRQFYFRKSDVGKSKAQVGRKRILQIDPTLQVVAICDKQHPTDNSYYPGSIYDPQYNVGFFNQFDLVISALDSDKAREYLVGMCFKAGKPMVDAGTEGYSGQSRSAVRHLTQCHNCKPSRAEQSFAVCTIRTRPERPIHCVAFAKLVYECFFGDNNQLKDELKREEYLSQNASDDLIRDAAIKLYDFYFRDNIQKLMGKESDDMSQIRPIFYEEALKMTEPVNNPESTFSVTEDKAQKKSEYAEQKLWSIADYTRGFVESFCNIVKTQRHLIGQLKFEKDDELCMMLVYCISQLRTYNFMNRVSKKNKHKFMTYFQIKDMAGNQARIHIQYLIYPPLGKIIAAISSTNSIAAGLEVQEVIKLLNNQTDKIKYTTFHNNNEDKICGLELSTPNLECHVCSYSNVYLRMQCDFSKITLSQFQDHMVQYLSHRRDIYGKNVDGICGRVLDASRTRNPKLKQTISQLQGIVNRGAAELYYQPTFNFNVFVYVYLVNNPLVQGIVDLSLQSIDEIKRNLVTHQRLTFSENIIKNKEYEFGDYGYK